MDMECDEPIVVRRGGFLSALAYGFFGTVCVLLICGAAIVLYGMRLVDRQLSQLWTESPELVTRLSHWQDALPPSLADAIDDRRAPELINQVEASVRLGVERHDPSRRVPVVTVKNTTDQTISLLSMRIVVEDDDGTPLEEVVIYGATPLAIDSSWRGPLPPGAERKFRTSPIRSYNGVASARVEITDMRVWRGDETEAFSTAPGDLRDAFTATAETAAWSEPEPSQIDVPAEAPQPFVGEITGVFEPTDAAVAPNTESAAEPVSAAEPETPIEESPQASTDEAAEEPVTPEASNEETPQTPTPEADEPASDEEAPATETSNEDDAEPAEVEATR